MKRILLLTCMALVLGSCGMGRKAVKTGGRALDGIQRSLTSAFASRDASRSGPIQGNGLCGIPTLVGEPAGDIPGKISGCGIKNAVRVTNVAGVQLSQPALMNCHTAQALTAWTEGTAKPAFGRLDGGLSDFRVAAHYACRTRNHQPGAKISEHGKGNAIDISAFRMADGTTYTVLGDYHRGKAAKAMKKMRQGACGPFKTVLGPGSDRFHDDHFHFDTAQHRGGGTYCR